MPRTVVIGNNDPAFQAVAERPRPGQRVVDLVRVVDRRSDGRRLRWHLLVGPAGS